MTSRWFGVRLTDYQPYAAIAPREQSGYDTWINGSKTKKAYGQHNVAVMNNAGIRDDGTVLLCENQFAAVLVGQTGHLAKRRLTEQEMIEAPLGGYLGVGDIERLEDNDGSA